MNQIIFFFLFGMGIKHIYITVEKIAKIKKINTRLVELDTWVDIVYLFNWNYNGKNNGIVINLLPPRSEIFLAMRLATLSHCLCKTVNQRCAPNAIPL
jgi:hypothetical protein